MVKSRYIGDGHPTFNRTPYNGYIKPYYWVDDHPLLYGNNGSLDPSTYEFIIFVISKDCKQPYWTTLLHLTVLGTTSGWQKVWHPPKKNTGTTSSHRFRWIFGCSISGRISRRENMKDLAAVKSNKTGLDLDLHRLAFRHSGMISICLIYMLYR